MKKLNKNILLLIAVALIGQSCKKEMIDINTNPYLLDDAAPEFIFTGATIDINYNSRDRTMHRYGRSMTYMQYVVPNSETPEGLSGAYWDSTRPTGPNPGFLFYNDYFQGIGRDMHRLITKIDALPEDQKATYQGLKAMALIVDTYHAWRVADIFGALPYSQAFQDVLFPL